MTPKKRTIAVIANPVAGRSIISLSWIHRLLGKRPPKNMETLLNTIVDFFNQNNTNCYGQLTTTHGDAQQFAKKAKQNNVDTIIAIGGDGTINEIIQVIANTPIQLGVIPTGTVNLLKLEFNLPTNIHTACQRILNSTPTTIDLGCVDGHYFTCMAGIGFDAFVVQHTSTPLKKWIGPLAYVASTIRAIFSFDWPQIKVIIDNTTTVTASIIIVCNIKYYGGRIALQPNAVPNDGHLNIIAIQNKTALGLLKTIISLIFKNQTNNPTITQHIAHSIEIITKQSPIQVDGDFLTSNGRRITLCKQSLILLS